MKKSAHTLLLVFSSLLLIVSVTVSVHAQTPDFAGEWDSVTDSGKQIFITIETSRRGVTGSYTVNGLTGSYKPLDSPVNGFVKVSALMADPVSQNLSWIRGTVKDNVLRFTWREDGGQGAGRFTLSSDGESFEGTFSRTSNPDDTSGGTWNGTRRYSFAGAWQGKLGDGALELILQQDGSRVTGQLKVNSAALGVVKEGIVVRNILRFKVVRPGKVLANGASLPDEYVGTAELVMNRGGKSFTGNVLGAAASGTFIGR